MSKIQNLTSRPLVGEITEAEAAEMTAAYNSDGKGITKCVWFSLEQMDQMITLLKAEALLGVGTDGLRVYFGTYTANTLGGMDPSYIGRNTAIFVSTAVDDTGNNHEDYFDGLELPKPFIPENRGEACQPNCNGTTLPGS